MNVAVYIAVAVAAWFALPAIAGGRRTQRYHDEQARLRTQWQAAARRDRAALRDAWLAGVEHHRSKARRRPPTHHKKGTTP